MRRRLTVLTADVSQTTIEVGAFEIVADQLQRRAIGDGGRFVPLHAPQQIGTRRVKQIIAVDRSGLAQLIHEGETLFIAARHRDGDRVVERHDRGRGHPKEGGIALVRQAERLAQFQPDPSASDPGLQA